MHDAKKAVEAIRRKLGHLTLEREPVSYLDTGSFDLNEVLGERKRGIAYGSLTEISGLESQGKTAIALTLAAKAQSEGALVLWADIENSFDAKWSARRGLDPEANNFVLFQPYKGIFGASKNTMEGYASMTAKQKKIVKRRAKVITAEGICTEIELAIKDLSRYYPKIFLGVDSLVSFQPAYEAEANFDERNRRHKSELSMFLSSLMRRWNGLAANYNVAMVLINQLRQNQSSHGDPFYTPGGNATRFYEHVRVQLHRVKGGKLKQGAKQIGIQGIIKNKKNKAGGLEHKSIGYKLFFDGPLKIVPAKSLERL